MACAILTMFDTSRLSDLVPRAVETNRYSPHLCSSRNGGVGPELLSSAEPQTARAVSKTRSNLRLEPLDQAGSRHATAERFTLLRMCR